MDHLRVIVPPSFDLRFAFHYKRALINQVTFDLNGRIRKANQPLMRANWATLADRW